MVNMTRFRAPTAADYAAIHAASVAAIGAPFAASGFLTSDHPAVRVMARAASSLPAGADVVVLGGDDGMVRVRCCMFGPCYGRDAVVPESALRMPMPEDYAHVPASQVTAEESADAVRRMEWSTGRPFGTKLEKQQ